MFPDITTYYNNDNGHVSDGYKRKRNEEPEIIGQCPLCLVYLVTGDLPHDECETEFYKRMEEEG